MTFPVSPALPHAVSVHPALSPFRKLSLYLIPDTATIKHSDSYMEVQELGIYISIFFVNNYFPYQPAVLCRLCPGSHGCPEAAMNCGHTTVASRRESRSGEGLDGIY